MGAYPPNVVLGYIGKQPKEATRSKPVACASLLTVRELGDKQTFSCHVTSGLGVYQSKRNPHYSSEKLGRFHGHCQLMFLNRYSKIKDCTTFAFLGSSQDL